MREICMSGSMSGVWKRSHGRASEAPPNERGGNGYVRPTATAPHLDSTPLCDTRRLPARCNVAGRCDARCGSATKNGGLIASRSSSCINKPGSAKGVAADHSIASRPSPDHKASRPNLGEPFCDDACFSLPIRGPASLWCAPRSSASLWLAWNDAGQPFGVRRSRLVLSIAATLGNQSRTGAGSSSTMA
jgi:hypothetical protein